MQPDLTLITSEALYMNSKAQQDPKALMQAVWVNIRYKQAADLCNYKHDLQYLMIT